jgi:urease accessory protein
VELVQPGRKYHGAGELFEYDLYSSALEVTRPDGTALCSEKIACEPWRYTVRRAGVMGEFDFLANVTVVTPPPHAATRCSGRKPTLSAPRFASSGDLYGEK